MLIYTLCMVFSSLFAYIYQKTKSLSPSKATMYGLVPRISIVLSCALIVVLSGTRVGVGVDYYSYENIFHAISTGSSTFVEPGFALLNAVVAIFTDNAQWIFFVTSLITIVLLYVFMARYSKNLAFSVFLLFGLCLIFFSFNTMRQFLAIGIAMLAFGPLLKRKLFRYMSIIVIASFFHTTALIMAPLYFLLSIRYTKLRVVAMAAGATVLYLMTPTVIELFLLLYPQHADNEVLLSGAQFSEVFILTPVILLLLIRKLIKNRMMTYTNTDRIYINIVFLILFFHLAFVWVPGMDRVNLYLDTMLLVAIPYIFHKMPAVGSKSLIMLSIIYFSTYAFISTYVNDSHHVLPYDSVLIPSNIREGDRL